MTGQLSPPPRRPASGADDAAETPAYRADIGAVRAFEPTLSDLPAWLRSTGWALPKR